MVREGELGLVRTVCPKCGFAFDHNPAYTGVCPVCISGRTRRVDTNMYKNYWMTRSSTQPVSQGLPYDLSEKDRGDVFGNHIPRDLTQKFRGHV